MNRKVLFITQAAVIAALYVVLTYVAALLGLSSGAIQVRFSEALTYCLILFHQLYRELRSAVFLLICSQEAQCLTLCSVQ